MDYRLNTVIFFLLVVFESCRSQIISGQGDFIFEYDPEALQSALFKLIDPSQLLNGHGLSKDLEGQLYFTFQPATVTPTTKALVRFSNNLQTATLLGDPRISLGVPHGLRIEHDETASQSFLYHANNAAVVTKTTLTGTIVWMSNFSDWEHLYPMYWPLRPTDAVVVPGTDTLLVADGYGSSYIHLLDKITGKYLGKSWGGPGNSNFPLKLSVPHGINVDERAGTSFPIFVISDRSNHRLVWADAVGNYISERSETDVFGMSWPCNVDVVVDKMTGNMVGVTPSLGDTYNSAFVNGSVTINGPGIGGKQEILSVIEVEKLIGNLGHQHPHDAVLLENGDLVVCCWSGPSDGPIFGPSKGTISYWRRQTGPAVQE